VTEMLNAALRYAAHGWPVFPCESRGKRPTTRNGLTDATTNREQIERWWPTDGSANVAVRTGKPSQLVVLDVDGDVGKDSLHELEREHGDLPDTASVITPRGGQHIYFTHPGHEIRNSAGQLGFGLDIRGDGGYVLAPPSMGANGRRYESDARCRLAACPPWLLELIDGSARGDNRPVATQASVWVNIVREGLPEGERNHGLTRLVGHLLARDVDARLVRELAHLVARRFTPPLPQLEVDQVVESIAGAELRKRKAFRR
jgi:bifunctional DNA primase/polymerase-like protein/primase-like protein